jgi:hypothetical protein
MQRNFKAPRPTSKKMLSNRGFSSSFYGPKGPDGGESDVQAAANTVNEAEAAAAEEEAQAESEQLGAGGERQSREYSNLVTGNAHSPRNGQSPRNARPTSVQQGQRSLPPTPHSQQQVTQHATYGNGVPSAMYDPAALEEQRRLYAQFQAQQQGVYQPYPGQPITPSRSPRGGRSVNVSPLGSRVPSGNFSYTSASASYQYSSQQGTGYAQAYVAEQSYTRPASVASSTILAQQQAYEAAQRSSRSNRSSQPPASTRSSQSASGSRGGSQHGYTPVSRGPVIGPDG